MVSEPPLSAHLPTGGAGGAPLIVAEGGGTGREREREIEGGGVIRGWLMLRDRIICLTIFIKGH